MSAPGGAPAAPSAPPHSLTTSALVCLFYAGTSIAISLLNKALLSSYGFSCYFLMLAAQLCMTLVFCVVSRDQLGNPFRIPAFSRETYALSVPMAAAYIANVCLGLVGLQMVNVPMFYCIRRTSTLFVLLYEFASTGRVAEAGVRGAVAVVCLGALIAGWESLGPDVLGYAITIANNVATAASTVMQKQFSERAKLSSGGSGGGGPFGIMYFQAMTALPLSLLCAAASGEFATLAAFPLLGDAGFWTSLFIASVMGLLLSYSSLLCTTYNSPTTTSVTGNAKDVVLTVFGALLFPGFKASLLSVSGIVISFCGSAMYTAVSVRRTISDQRARTAHAAAAAETHAAASKAAQAEDGSAADGGERRADSGGATGGAGAAPLGVRVDEQEPKRR